MENTFKIRLADRTFELHCLYDYTKNMCRDYVTHTLADDIVSISDEDILAERQYSKITQKAEGKHYNHSDAYLESLAVYRKIANILANEDTLLFHGSCIAMDGKAYIFTARSGMGKSTHTHLWREIFGDKAVMVNDDKPILRITDKGVTAYGTPWDGKHHLSSNISVPLDSICILCRANGGENRIEPIGRKQAFPILLEQTYRPRTADSLTKIVTNVGRLSSMVRLYRMECNIEKEAAKMAYQTMGGHFL